MVNDTRLLSVIIPVCNALPHLHETLQSLAAQGLDETSFEVIAVDDGSTDGSADVLYEYARQHQNFRVVRQDHGSGTGRARNVGLASSSAPFVCFLDADHIFAPDALRRMVAFAEEHGSDIVIPRLTPLGRRAFPAAPHQETRFDVDLIEAFEMLSSPNLYRRTMLEDNSIRFPEGTTWLAEAVFNGHAYLHAKRISMLSGGDYDFFRAPEDAQPGREDLDPTSYTSSVSDICQEVRNHLGRSETADHVITDVYRRKCLHVYQPHRFAGYDEATRNVWVSAHHTFAWQFVSDAMEQRLASPFRERSYFVRRADSAGLLALGEAETKPAITASLAAVRWSDDDVEVEFEASIAGRLALPRQLVCEVRRRDGDGGSAFPVIRREEETPEYGRSARFYGAFPFQSINVLLPGTYDLHLTSLSDGERWSARVRWDERVPVPSARTGFRIYATKRGHASVQKTEMPLRMALGRVFETLWRR